MANKTYQEQNKAIVLSSHCHDDIVDGKIVFALSPFAKYALCQVLDVALVLLIIGSMTLLSKTNTTPLLGMALVFLRLFWFFPAQKVRDELMSNKSPRKR
ncbi:MAG: hypothetical protein HRF47_10150 [Chloroflexota bacterium]|jgi:hypothetical protein